MRAWPAKGGPPLRLVLPGGPPLSLAHLSPCSGLWAGALVWLEQLQPQLWPGHRLPAPGAASASPGGGQLPR